MAAAWPSFATPGETRSVPSAATPAAASASPTAGGQIGYVFSTKTGGVTLFDPTTRRVIGSGSLSATVRWLSNEQRFWDGGLIWTYDFPDNAVQAVGIDPAALVVARTLPANGAGPAHSLMLTPDRSQVWVNAAGDDKLVVLDVASGQIVAEVATGAYP